MNNLTQEQIRRVFAMYWGQEIFIRTPQRFPEIEESPCRVNCNTIGWLGSIKPSPSSEPRSGYLLLTPLSKISDEDAIEVAKFSWLGVVGANTSFEIIRRDDFAVWVEGYDYLRIRHYMCFDKYGAVTTSSHFPKYEDESNKTFTHNIGEIQTSARDGAPYQMIFQFLTQRGYAVPLFLAPGHPDNGKDAIQLGLAIEKP